MSNDLIITSVSQLGDFLLIFPVASWIYKTYNRKIHFVLSDNFPIYKKAESLILCQDFTNKVSYVDVEPNSHKTEVFAFNPKKFGIDGEYINIGFYKYPDRYLSEFYASFFNLGVDYDYQLKLSLSLNDSYKDKRVYIESSTYRCDFNEIFKYVTEEDVRLNISDSVEYNCSLAYGAKEVLCSMNGFSVAMDLMKKPMSIYTTQDEITRQHFYYKTQHNFTPVF